MTKCKCHLYDQEPVKSLPRDARVYRCKICGEWWQKHDMHNVWFPYQPNKLRPVLPSANQENL